MAGRFMKIKKIVIPFMTLVILTGQLAGCATMADDEMQESQQDPPDVSVVTGQQTATDVSDQDDSNIEVIGDKEEKQPLSGDALIRYFQLTYDSCVTLDSASQKEQISFELNMLASFCDTDGEKLPSDYETQYKSWRPAEEEKTPDAPEKTTPSPAKPSTSGNNQQKPADNQQQDQGSTNGSYDPDADAWNPYEGMTPEEKEAQIKADQEATQKAVDGITGTFG
ncbi:MAG: hypothetical protein HFF49_08970 [Lawsonibacter sp.]|jgi:hypothetical protein|nr:hypothetical protein [Lawsonibacter sp.]